MKKVYSEDLTLSLMGGFFIMSIVVEDTILENLK